MKTAELTGADLDYWVAIGLGAKAKMSESNERGLCLVLEIDEEHGDGSGWFPFSPSANWAQGGPIIEREKITTVWLGEEWLAGMLFEAFNEWPWWRVAFAQDGEAQLIAAMRAYVASKFGEEVGAARPPAGPEGLT